MSESTDTPAGVPTLDPVLPKEPSNGQPSNGKAAPPAPEPPRAVAAASPAPVAAAPVPTPPLARERVKRPGLLPLPETLVKAGRSAPIVVSPDQDFSPVRLVLHHACVRPLVFDDFRVEEGDGGPPEALNTTAFKSKLLGKGPIVAECFIAAIAENHTPYLGKILASKRIVMLVRNVGPADILVQGHYLGTIDVDVEA